MMSFISPTTPNRKRHTKPCIYFQNNQCPFNADECDFAHIYDEQAMSGPDALRSKYRTKPCRYYLAGSCTQETWCRFKHPVGHFPISPQIGEEEEDKDYSDVPDVRDVEPHMKRQREQHPKYKTRPCREWMMGTCRRGNLCSYLHEHVPSGMSHGQSNSTSPLGITSFPPYSVYPAASPLGTSLSCSSISSDEGALSLLWSPNRTLINAYNDDGPPTPKESFQHYPSAIDGQHQASSLGMMDITSPHNQWPSAYYAVTPFHAYVKTQGQPMAALGGPWSPSGAPFNTGGSPRSRSQPATTRKRSGTHHNKIGHHSNMLDGGLKVDKAIQPDVLFSASSAVPRTVEYIDLPDKPKTAFEDMRSKGYYPITWRVVGGGVKLAKQQNLAEEPTSISNEPVQTTVPPQDSKTTPTARSHPNSPAMSRHTRTSPRSLKTLSVSIPASARLLAVQLEDEHEVDILQVRSTPSSPARGRYLTVNPIHLY